MDERLSKAVLDTRVVRGSFGETDHFMVLLGVRIRVKWKYGVKKNGEVKVLANVKMNCKKYREEYESKVNESSDGSAVNVGMQSCD